MSSTVSSGKLHHVNFETKHDENKNEHGVVTNDDYSIYKCVYEYHNCVSF